MADLETSLNQNKESPSAGGGGLLMGALGLGTGLLNSIGSYLGMKAQAKEQKELLDYQWRNMTSPRAQVSNWAAEGFNPASMFGNQAQPANVGSIPSVTAPQFGVGTMDMSSLASYISALADAKKKGVEVPNIREDTNSKIIENDRKQYELELLRKYGDKKEYQALALAEQKVKLALQEQDINEQKKAINEYEKAKQAALKVTAEHQRDILKKELDNKDVELKLRNEESRQRAAASKASAAESYSAASLNKEKANTERSQQKINDFVASIKENERNFNQASFDVRFRQELAKLDMLEINTMLEGIKANDQAAYTAFQRILFGKTQEGDFKKVVNALENIDNVTYGFKSLSK